jgi:hypothetical protein
MEQIGIFEILIFSAAVWIFGAIAWLAFKYRKHHNPSSVQAALRGEKQEIDPKIAEQFAQDMKAIRQVSGAIWITLILLVIGVSIYNMVSRK